MGGKLGQGLRLFSSVYEAERTAPGGAIRSEWSWSPGKQESKTILGASCPLTHPYLEDKQQQLVSTTCSPDVLKNKLRKLNCEEFLNLRVTCTNSVTQRGKSDGCLKSWILSGGVRIWYFDCQIMWRSETWQLLISSINRTLSIFSSLRDWCNKNDRFVIYPSLIISGYKRWLHIRNKRCSDLMQWWKCLYINVCVKYRRKMNLIDSILGLFKTLKPHRSVLV